MTDLRLHAVCVLLDEASTRTIRWEQERLAAIVGDRVALRFPVHLTLRGRFWAEPGAAEQVVRSLGTASLSRSTLVRLDGPVRVEDWLWFECLPGQDGHEAVRQAHEAVESALRDVVVRDEVLEAHRGLNFRPHVTLAWNVPSPLVAERLLLTLPCHVESLALLRYPVAWPNGDDPVKPAVVVVPE